MGLGGARTNLYPGAYIKDGSNWSQPTPETMDAFMAAALAANVTPILLFEYYSPQFDAATGWGSWEQWRGVGAAFCAYLCPGGTWALRVGAPVGFGVTVFTAVNEPDIGQGFVTGGAVGPAAYAAGLSGLSAGVKGVFATARVLPGGFAAPNARGDMTLGGLAPHLGPLWANETLDGLDLHTYYDVQYAPMNGTFAHSTQANYDGVLAAAGIGGSSARGISFATTEFNFKERLVNDTVAAAGFLTGIWDQLTVSSLQNEPLAAQAFPWNIFNNRSVDVDYFMAASLGPPYQPAPRGCAFALVAALLRVAGGGADWAWESVDPRGTGVARLRAPSGALLVVWQNRPAWTSLPDTHAFELAGLAPGTAAVRVYGWEGLRRTLAVPPAAASVNITGLPGGETYMFLAQPAGAVGPVPVHGCGIWW